MKRFLLYLCLVVSYPLFSEIDSRLQSLLQTAVQQPGIYTVQEDITEDFCTLYNKLMGHPLDTEIKAFIVMRSHLEYIIVVTDPDITILLANLIFSHRLKPDNQPVGHIDILHVVTHAFRKHGLGSTLLRYALQRDYRTIDRIELFACPFDVGGQCSADLFPKLLGFYQKNGAHIEQLNTQSANLFFNVPQAKL